MPRQRRGIARAECYPGGGKNVVFGQSDDARLWFFARELSGIGRGAKSAHRALPRTADGAAKQTSAPSSMSAELMQTAAALGQQGGGDLPEMRLSRPRCRSVAASSLGARARARCWHRRSAPLDRRRSWRPRRRYSGRRRAACAISVASAASGLGNFPAPREPAALEVSRAGVIAEALPRVQDIGRFRARERGEIRKAREPAFVIRQHGRDLRLLEHELGDENGVRIACSPPGQIAPVTAKPGGKLAAKARGIQRTET